MAAAKTAPAAAQAATTPTTAEQLAQQLVRRRENWVKTLDALPMPKARVPEPPYPSMAAAAADEFKLFDGGPDGAWKILVKGWKTSAWRKAAEKNRVARDEAAEGDAPASLLKRVEKAAAAAAAEEKSGGR